MARCAGERLTREPGLAWVVRGKPAKTTMGDVEAACPLDKMNRQVRALEPDRL